MPSCEAGNRAFRRERACLPRTRQQHLGDRSRNLAAARSQVAALGEIGKESSVFETEPWQVDPTQNRFLNQVIELTTELDAVQLLLTLQAIEHDLGRGPHARGEPRTIDLDILLFGDAEIATVGTDYTLFVPHPGITERAFVLVPLLEIAPKLVHPVLGVSFRELVDSVDTSTVKPWYG